ncbi:MAG: hypothetical protein JXR58_12630 [Bacteroidales bacterium]|nr:hypothetical protein [Bacteroidales bacterium]
MKKALSIAIISAFALIVVSCGESEKKDDKNLQTRTDTVVKDEISPEEVLVGKLELFILNDFFPTDIFKILNETGFVYNSVYMNPVSKLESYTSSNTKAFVLGVYGADLNYSICNNKASDAMTYLSTSKTIAEEVNVPMAFDEELIAAYQENIDNKDQLSMLIIDAYDNASQMLKSNEQLEMSVLVIAGGWYEGLYLAVANYKEANEELNSFLAQQKSKLEKIKEIMELFEGDEYITKVKSHFTKISEFLNANYEFNAKNIQTLKSILEEARKEII